jgi:cytochrome P450
LFFLFSIARRDVEIRGVAIPAGAEVGLYLGAANRDPEVFPDPDRLDITRTGAAQLAFGYGGHFCMGAALARLEAQVAMAALVERYPKLRLKEGEHHWRPGLILHGLTELQLRFD